MEEEKDNFQAFELMRRAISGDRDAFGLLYEHYFSPIYRYIYFRVQNKSVAEDITQAVFLKVFEKLPSYRDLQRPPLAYLFTIARNKVIDHWRKNKRLELFAEDNNLNLMPDTGNEPDKIIFRTSAVQELSQALENIPPEQRDVIIYKYLNELSYSEIAKLLKKKEEAIRQLASRGLKSLRQYFAAKKIYE
jgi:RNA polymerase sigma-70 factor, ECF subfamily